LAVSVLTVLTKWISILKVNHVRCFRIHLVGGLRNSGNLIAGFNVKFS
jgi:hypothetical protein